MTVPARHRTKLQSANPTERLNGEIKRRTDVLAILPKEPAIRRLVRAILMKQTGEWTVQLGRYMTLKPLAPNRDELLVACQSRTEADQLAPRKRRWPVPANIPSCVSQKNLKVQIPYCRVFRPLHLLQDDRLRGDTWVRRIRPSRPGWKAQNALHQLGANIVL